MILLALMLAAGAPHGRVLPPDLSQVDEEKLLRSGNKGALAAIADWNPTRVPVVLVHGIRGAPGNLQPIFDKLRGPQRQLFAYAYDSWWHRRTSQSGDDLAEELRALGKDLGGGRDLVIVAHSMGGIVARRALNNMVFGRQKGAELYRRIRLVAIDTPWHGYYGPADSGAEGFFMGVVALFMPNALEDMRARSAMFQGDPKGADPGQKRGLLNVVFPGNVEVDVIFAQGGTEAWDYTEDPLRPLVAKLVDYFKTERPIQAEPWVINHWRALIQSTRHYAFSTRMEQLANQGQLNEGTARAALLEHFPRYAGDHMGVLHDAKMLDWLATRVVEPLN